MKLIELENGPDTDETKALIRLYETSVEKISEKLGKKIEDIPHDISLKIEEGEGAYYSKGEKRITYRVPNNASLLSDKGRLIHEAVHVVQNYSFDSNKNMVVWCWSEGIADYFRALLDEEFFLGDDLKCDPEVGYKEAAKFLFWLEKKNTDVVADLNLFLSENGRRVSRHDDIFCNLKGVKMKYQDLKRDYFYENYSNRD